MQLCPRPKNTMKEVACSVSHTTAIRNIFHRMQPGVVPRDYGIVLEDDMRFVFNIDFDALVASAPKDWGILQVRIFHHLICISELKFYHLDLFLLYSWSYLTTFHYSAHGMHM